MTNAIDIGSRRELFTDDLLIDRMIKAVPFLHEPQPREVVLRHDTPWEVPFSIYHTVICDGGRILLYYRGWIQTEELAVYCVAESRDGIHFERPALGIQDWNGDTANNIFLSEAPYAHTFAPFLDERPGTPPDERFKAFARGETGESGHRRPALFGFASSDGLKWRKLYDEPIITDGNFDSQNVGFWSQMEGKYVAYYRVFPAKEEFASGTTPPTTTATRLRAMMRATSDDFRHWTPGVLMDYRTHGRPAPVEEFYINQTHPYFRAPHIYVALPARFMKQRRAITAEEADAACTYKTQRDGCSDACFMTTRPGNAWYDRNFMEAFVKPRIGPSHWSARCNYPANGVIQTGSEEMSFYVDEQYAQPTNQVRRYSLRLDGFCSVRAPHDGGELITRPLVFAGQELELNYATSAAGSMRVEIRNPDNAPTPGYRLRDAVDIFGNRLDGVARWRNGTDVSALAGLPIRLRFVMRDADLFSLRFKNRS